MEAYHYDEEDCLGPELFVAELELVLGARDRKPDQVQLLELLQKLLTSIGTAEPAAVKRNQCRCEAALADLLHRGACPVVRARCLPPRGPGWFLQTRLGVHVAGAAATGIWAQMSIVSAADSGGA